MTSAKEIMHTGVACIREHETLTTAAQHMRDLDIGALPVCGDDDRLHGMSRPAAIRPPPPPASSRRAPSMKSTPTPTSPTC